jgi:hypothetical protein
MVLVSFDPKTADYGVYDAQEQEIARHPAQRLILADFLTPSEVIQPDEKIADPSLRGTHALRVSV